MRGINTTRGPLISELPGRVQLAHDASISTSKFHFTPSTSFIRSTAEDDMEKFKSKLADEQQAEKPIASASIPERPNPDPDQDDPEYIQTLQDLRARLKTADARIIRFNNALRDAQLERAKIGHAINEQLKTRPPIHKFPPEVLAHIFWYTLDEEDPFEVFETETGPWLLGQVCRKWRTIVWETPRLWSTFSIDWVGFISRAMDPDNTREEALRLFTDMFARTKQVPLIVNVNFDYDSWIHDCIDLVAREAHRIEDLALAGTAKELSKRMAGKFYQLSKLISLILTIEGSDDYGYDDDDEEDEGGEAEEKEDDPHANCTPATFPLAPLLVRVDLHFRGHPPPRTALHLPYAQLRHLHIDFEPYPDFESLSMTLSILRKCPNLETFQDSSHYPMSILALQPEESASISLNHLESLSIFSPLLLFHIITPALKSLMFLHSRGDLRDLSRHHSFGEIGEDFQRRSQCRIDTAFLLPIPPSPSCRAFLRGFADLTSLAISAWQDDDHTALFISLLKQEPEEMFMPHLEILVVYLSATPHLRRLLHPEPELPQDSLIELALGEAIISRRNVPSGEPVLKTVKLTYLCPGWDNGTRTRGGLDLDDMFSAATATTLYSKLCDLEQEGLDVRLNFDVTRAFYWENDI